MRSQLTDFAQTVAIPANNLLLILAGRVGSQCRGGVPHEARAIANRAPGQPHYAQQAVDTTSTESGKELSATFHASSTHNTDGALLWHGPVHVNSNSKPGSQRRKNARSDQQCHAVLRFLASKQEEHLREPSELTDPCGRRRWGTRCRRARPMRHRPPGRWWNRRTHLPRRTPPRCCRGRLSGAPVGGSTRRATCC